MDQELLSLQTIVQNRDNQLKQQEKEYQQTVGRHEVYRDKVKGLKYFIEALLLKCRGLQENFEYLQNEKTMIQAERKWMADRAAVGFTNLTPRPDIKTICKEESVDYEVLFDKLLPKEEKKRKKKHTVEVKRLGLDGSTVQVVTHLVA